MLLTIHAIFALIFAKFLPNVYWAFLIGFASHFILDMIPHGDREADAWSDDKKMRRLPTIAFFDILLLLILIYFIFHRLNLPLAIAWALMLGAVAPDAIQAGFMTFSKNPFDNLYAKIHHAVHKYLSKNLLSYKAGAIVQLLFLIYSIFLLTLLYR